MASTMCSRSCCSAAPSTSGRQASTQLAPGRLTSARRLTTARQRAVAAASSQRPTAAAAAVFTERRATRPQPPCRGPQSPQNPGHFSVLGLAQGIVDCTYTRVTDGDLEALGLEKGGRRVLNAEERAAAIQLLAERPSQVSAGGSLANTLQGIARLARALRIDLPQVAMAGGVGTDLQGKFFTSQMQQAGVRVIPDGQVAHTGSVMVLATPDAQRSFLCFFPETEGLALPPHMREAVQRSSMVVVEGYLWEAPGAAKTIAQVVAAARAAGSTVVLTAGDPTVVARHKAAMLEVLASGNVDMMFCNLAEASELLSQQDWTEARAGLEPSAHHAAAVLGSLVPCAVVTDGSNGSCISALGEVHAVPCAHTPRGVVDTCGAGDAFAAGVLFGLMAGYGFQAAGELGARVAATVIGRHSAALSQADAEEVAAAVLRRGPLRARRLSAVMM